jgi:Uma2 family endonuclease
VDEIRETVAIYRSRKCTYEDYAKLPEGAPYQLIGGELVLSPAPSLKHQRVARKLATKMTVFAEDRDLGEVYHAPTDVYFNEEETYQPDIVFIPWDRESILDDGKVNGAPDLVVEVLSPSTANDDLITKFQTYERYGVKEYWIIDPKDNSIKVYLHNEGRLSLGQVVQCHGLIESKVLSGFAVEAEYLFRRR